MIALYLNIFLITLVTLIFFSIYANKIHFLDRPVDRSSHIIPTPKSSGIIICFIYSLAIYLVSENEIFLLISLSIISFLGLIDDLYNLNAKLKLFFQLLTITIIYIIIINLDYPRIFENELLNYILFLIFSVYFINIFNFMDGIDALSIFQSIFAILMLILFSYLSEVELQLNVEINIFICILLSQLILYFSKYKSFIGDSGSLYISLVIFVFYYLNEDFDLIIYLIIVFSFYIFDTSLTLIKRILKKDNILIAHKEHFYQLIAIKLNSHFKTNLIIILFNTLIVTPSLVMFIYNRDNYLIVFVPFIVLLVIYNFTIRYVRKIS